MNALRRHRGSFHARTRRKMGSVNGEGQSRRIASEDTVNRRVKGLKRGGSEREETLIHLRETLPEHSYTACNEQAEKQ